MRYGAALAVLLAAALAWGWYTGAYHPDAVLEALRQHEDSRYAPLFVVLVYAVAGFLFVPVMLLIALTGLIYGPVYGGLYALLGALASGVCGYAAGRCVAADTIARHAGPRIQKVQQQLRSRGLAAMIFVRVVPSGPYTLTNMLAGAVGVRLRDFVLGSLIGLAPGIAVTVGLVHGLSAAWQRPGLRTVGAAVAAFAVVVVLGYGMRSAIARFRKDDAR